MLEKWSTGQSDKVYKRNEKGSYLDSLLYNPTHNFTVALIAQYISIHLSYEEVQR